MVELQKHQEVVCVNLDGRLLVLSFQNALRAKFRPVQWLPGKRKKQTHD